MKSFKTLREELGSGPANVTAGVAVGPNDIGVDLKKRKRKSSLDPILTINPLTRKI